MRLTYRDKPPFTLTLSIPDDLAVEDDANNVAQIRVALSRALVSGETVTVPLNFAGASRPADFNLVLGSNFTGVSLSGSTVTFTGPSVAAATMNVLAVSDSTDDDETVTVSLGTVTSTGVTVNRETTVNSQIRLLETAPYTPSPGPPLVIVDSIVPIGGSCTGRECEITEAPAGSDIIINVRLVRPALEKGVGFIPVAATRQIAVNAYLQPGVHAHQWLTPPTFAVGEKIKTWLLRMSPSTLVESDVRRMLMFSGPVGSWGEGNPPPFGVVTNDPYWITIKDGPDGNAGTIAPIVTIRHTYWQELDGGAAEGRPVHFEVSAPSPAQGRFPVYLKVEQTAGDCVAPANLRTHKVTFPPRVASVGFSVATVDDSTGEQDCTVKVSLARADGTVPGGGDDHAGADRGPLRLHHRQDQRRQARGRANAPGGRDGDGARRRLGGPQGVLRDGVAAGAGEHRRAGGPGGGPRSGAERGPHPELQAVGHGDAGRRLHGSGDRHGAVGRDEGGHSGDGRRRLGGGQRRVGGGPSRGERRLPAVHPDPLGDQDSQSRPRGRGAGGRPGAHRGCARDGGADAARRGAREALAPGAGGVRGGGRSGPRRRRRRRRRRRTRRGIRARCGRGSRTR